MTGQTLSHYQIQEKLGEGGMGVVYKALDTHLNRPVALKLLPADKVSNPERRKRFVQEARAASALNHPHIVTIYDIASHDSHDFIAMEFIQGRTLDQLQHRKSLPLADTLKYSVQIADALAKAHAAGIVHRDLKPSNIMVTEDGRAKVLDFGLAKLVEPDQADADASTRTLQEAAPKTDEGAIVGTAAYMSPEQAEGKKLDGRSDIFSFGSVLYEMSTGRRAFRGETKLSTLSAILREEPKPASELAAAVPRELERIIQRCLRKDPARRFQHIDDVKVALEELKEESDSGKLTQVPLAAPNRRTRRLAWIAAVLVPAALAGMAWWNWHRQPLEPKQALTQPIPVTSYPGIEGHPTFSPDARQIAFHWNGEKQDNFDIYVKLTDSSAPPLRLTSNPAPDWAPEWSPDGKTIAFIREPGLRGAVYLIPPLGGPERKLCDTRGDVLAWHPDGKRIAIMDRTSGEEPYHITLVDVFTGEGKAVTRPGADHIGDGAPAFSPNGETLAFVRWPIPADGQLHILGLREGGEKLSSKGAVHQD